MARNIRQANTITGAGLAIGLDFLVHPFNATVGVDLSQATGVTYAVQYTLSDLNDPAVIAVGALWRADPTLGTNQTTSGVTYYTSPVFAVRINISAISTGTVYVEVLQGMSAR